jgi:DNA-binding Xre family transcriptional regulator
MKQNIVGEKIRSVMTARNISMAELSDRTGLSDTQINFILESEVVPSLAPLIKIARGLGVRLGTFLDDSEQMGPALPESPIFPPCSALSCASASTVVLMSSSDGKKPRNDSSRPK